MKNEENLSIVLNVIKDETGVTLKQMQSESRKQPIVWARYLFFHAVEFYLHWKDREAYGFIGIDRTTHIHAHKKHIEFLQLKDRTYTTMYTKITKRLTDYFYSIPKDEPLNNWQLKNARLFNQSMLVGIDRTEYFNGADKMIRRNRYKNVDEMQKSFQQA